MFYRNNTALVALFVFAAISFQNLSHAQLNIVTAGSASDLGGNCYEITPDQVYLSVVNPIFSPTITTTFTVSITDICGDVTTECVLITVNPTITPTFTPINPICEGTILLNLPTISNNGFRDT